MKITKEFFLKKASVFLNAAKYATGLQNVTVGITVTDTLDKNQNGACRSLGSDTYEIFLNVNTDPVQLLKTICHEMIHVKQISDGALQVFDTGFAWFGKFFSFGDLVYSKRPWEVEARKCEAALFTKVLSNVAA